MNRHKNIEYECVYYFLDEPLLQTDLHNDKIHKLLINDFYLRNELTNVKSIRQFKRHFYVPENNYTTYLNDMDEYNLEYITTDKSTLLVEFENKILIDLKQYLNTSVTPQKYISNIIHFYKHLLTSIHLLVQNQLVFNHINVRNIVIDTYEIPLLTNFALSIDISHDNFQQYITHFILSYDPTYIEWPIEFHLLAYIQTNKLKSVSYFNIETVVNDVLSHNSILASFGDKIVSSYKAEAIHFFSKYINKSYDYILTDITSHYGTWDNYSLSILFLKILINIHKSINVQNKFIILFMKLLVCNIHTNPLKRLSIESTIQQFNSLVDSISLDVFHNLFESLTMSA